MYGLTTTVEPTDEPVDVPTAKLHLSLDVADNDPLVDLWIRAARKYAEVHTGKRFLTQTVKVTLDCWPNEEWFRVRCDEIRIPIEPVSAVSTLKYYDTDAALTTVSAGDYYTALTGSPPLIVPKSSVTWPDLEEGRPEAIEITVVAGVASPLDLDQRIAQAILMTLAYWDQNRGGEANESTSSLGLPAGAKRLLDSIWTGAY